MAAGLGLPSLARRPGKSHPTRLRASHHPHSGSAGILWHAPADRCGADDWGVAQMATRSPPAPGLPGLNGSRRMESAGQTLAPARCAPNAAQPAASPVLPTIGVLGRRAGSDSQTEKEIKDRWQSFETLPNAWPVSGASILWRGISTCLFSALSPVKVSPSETRITRRSAAPAWAAAP